MHLRCSNERVVLKEMVARQVDGSEQSLEILFQINVGFIDAEKNRRVRDPERVEHSLYDLLKQRVFQIALGYYKDRIDADALRYDPVLQISVGKDQPLVLLDCNSS